MTTIAYRNGVLAADTRALYGGNEIVCGRIVKVRKTKDGRLIGICGIAHPAFAYGKALSEGTELPEFGEHCGVVVEVKRNRQVFEHSYGGVLPLGRLKFGSWGSGSMAARAALILGYSAMRAVEIAKKCDAGTGGKIIEVEL